MTRIIGLMPIDPDSPLVCYKKRTDGFEVASQQDVASSKDLVVLVPATDVGIYNIKLPTRNETEARRAAPFTIEDELAVAAEDIHIALGDKSSKTPEREIHVCDPSKLEAWITRLEQTKHLRAARLVADASVTPQGNFALDIDDRIIARSADKRFAVDESISDDALNAIVLSSASAPSVYGRQLASRLSQPSAGTEDPLNILLNWAYESENLIDLRQGKFAVRRSSGFDWSHWYVPAGLAAAVSIAWLSTVALESRALSNLTDQMTANSRSIYTAAFPGKPVPRNLIQSVRGASAKGDVVDFRSASALLYAGLNEVGGPGIQSLRYDEAGATLRARISYDNFGDELKLKTHLEKFGITVKIGEMRQQAGRVSGELTMELTQ